MTRQLVSAATTAAAASAALLLVASASLGGVGAQGASPRRSSSSASSTWMVDDDDGARDDGAHMWNSTAADLMSTAMTLSSSIASLAGVTLSPPSSVPVEAYPTGNNGATCPYPDRFGYTEAMGGFASTHFQYYEVEQSYQMASYSSSISTDSVASDLEGAISSHPPYSSAQSTFSAHAAPKSSIGFTTGFDFTIKCGGAQKLTWGAVYVSGLTVNQYGTAQQDYSLMTHLWTKGASSITTYSWVNDGTTGHNSQGGTIADLFNAAKATMSSSDCTSDMEATVVAGGGVGVDVGITETGDECVWGSEFDGSWDSRIHVQLRAAPTPAAAASSRPRTSATGRSSPESPVSSRADNGGGGGSGGGTHGSSRDGERKLRADHSGGNLSASTAAMCNKQCRGQSYFACVCPCEKTAMTSKGGTWAQGMRC